MSEALWCLSMQQSGQGKYDGQSRWVESRCMHFAYAFLMHIQHLHGPILYTLSPIRLYSMIYRQPHTSFPTPFSHTSHDPQLISTRLGHIVRGEENSLSRKVFRLVGSVDSRGALFPAGGADLAVLVGELERLDDADGLFDRAADGEVVHVRSAEGAGGVDKEGTAQGDAFFGEEDAVCLGDGVRAVSELGGQFCPPSSRHGLSQRSRREWTIGKGGGVGGRGRECYKMTYKGEVQVGAETALLTRSLGPGQVGEFRVGRDADDLGVDGLELLDSLVECEDLGGADDCRVSLSRRLCQSAGERRRIRVLRSLQVKSYARQLMHHQAGSSAIHHQAAPGDFATLPCTQASHLRPQ